MRKVLGVLISLACCLPQASHAIVGSQYHDCDAVAWIEMYHGNEYCGNTNYQGMNTTAVQCTQIDGLNNRIIKSEHLVCSPNAANGAPGCDWSFTMACHNNPAAQGHITVMTDSQGRYPACMEETTSGFTTGFACRTLDGRVEEACWCNGTIGNWDCTTGVKLTQP